MSDGSIRWLHLSDFHFGKDHYGQRRLAKHIIDNVEENVATNLAPDFVFITGVLANKVRWCWFRGC